MNLNNRQWWKMKLGKHERWILKEAYRKGELRKWEFLKDHLQLEESKVFCSNHHYFFRYTCTRSWALFKGGNEGYNYDAINKNHCAMMTYQRTKNSLKKKELITVETGFGKNLELITLTEKGKIVASKLPQYKITSSIP